MFQRFHGQENNIFGSLSKSVEIDKSATAMQDNKTPVPFPPMSIAQLK